MTTHPNLLLRLRMNGTVYSFPSWHALGQLYLLLYLLKHYFNKWCILIHHFRFRPSGIWSCVDWLTITKIFRIQGMDYHIDINNKFIQNVSNHQSTWCHTPEYLNLHHYCCKTSNQKITALNFSTQYWMPLPLT
jgi:hypothetical protein